MICGPSTQKKPQGKKQQQPNNPNNINSEQQKFASFVFIV